MFGEEVSVHVGAGARKHGVLHCDISGKAEVAGLAIPIWMFEPSICQRMQLRQDPFVDMSSLEILKQLLIDTVGYSKTKGVTDGQYQDGSNGEAAGDHLVVSTSTSVVSADVECKKRDDAAVGRDANRRGKKSTRGRREGRERIR